jgi:hypothetical protein
VALASNSLCSVPNDTNYLMISAGTGEKITSRIAQAHFIQ